jgi:hypothetical protein
MGERIAYAYVTHSEPAIISPGTIYTLALNNGAGKVAGYRELQTKSYERFFEEIKKCELARIRVVYDKLPRFVKREDSYSAGKGNGRVTETRIPLFETDAPTTGIEDILDRSLV